MRITEQMILENLLYELRNIIQEQIDTKYLHPGIHVSREYSVPYLCGYSEDGTTIYIDKDLPKELGFDEPLIIHEIVEKTLEDTLKDEHYQSAHHLALKLEDYFVRLFLKMDPKEYEDILKKYIKMAYEKKLDICPPDLSLKPYEDEGDYETIEKIKKAQQRD